MPLTTNLHRSVLIQHSQYAFLLWNFPLTYTFWSNVNGNVFFLDYLENFTLLLFQGFPVTKEKFKQIDVFPEFSSGRKRTKKIKRNRINKNTTRRDQLHRSHKGSIQILETPALGFTTNCQALSHTTQVAISRLPSLLLQRSPENLWATT